MNRSTRVFLVLLQIVIGWHLFYEGWWKFQEPSWSSRGYLRNASGPFALLIRRSVGDPDVKRNDQGQLVAVDPTTEIRERFTPKPLDAGEKPEDRRWHNYLPDVLVEEWDEYFNSFKTHYDLDSEDHRPRLKMVERNLEIAKGDTAKWLHEGTKKVSRPNIKGEVSLTTQQRLSEYLDKVQEVRDLEMKAMDIFGSKVTDKYREAKGQENALHAALWRDLSEQSNGMKRSLREVLTYEEKRMALPKETETIRSTEWLVKLPAVEKPVDAVSWIDWKVKWSLVIFGGCLMIGLFTRLACLGASGLLLMFYLVMPSLPGMPTNPMSPGHYLIINMNLIEIMALLTIMVAHTGLWYGLDAWIDVLKPWRWRSADRADGKAKARSPHAAARKEIPSGNGGAVASR